MSEKCPCCFGDGGFSKDSVSTLTQALQAGYGNAQGLANFHKIRLLAP